MTSEATAGSSSQASGGGVRRRADRPLFWCCVTALLFAVPASGERADLGDSIRESEYRVTWQEGVRLGDVGAAWQAPNRAHGFRTYFLAEGIRLVPRLPDKTPWELGLSLVGYGRKQHVATMPSSLPAVEEKRVDYDRGSIVEWYVNDHRGLKQGFTLTHPPEDPRGGEGHAYLLLKLSGNLRPTVSAGGSTIAFARVTGSALPVLHYHGLEVVDADGKPLLSWMEFVPGRGAGAIRLMFDDQEASYPVTVDPWLTGEAWWAEGNQTGASFGYVVTNAGDVNGDGYGDVAIGVPDYDKGQVNEGRVFVYQGSASGLGGTPAWTAEGNLDGASFGESVAGADVNGDGFDDLIVGAPGFSNSNFEAGAVFVYYGSVSGLVGAPGWINEGGEASLRRGSAVGGAGDVNGDGNDDLLVRDGNRTIHVYHGSATGSPVFAQSLDMYQCSTVQSHPIAAAGAGDFNGDGFADVVHACKVFSSTLGGWVRVDFGSTSGLWASSETFTGGGVLVGGIEHSLATAGDVDGDGYDDVIVGEPHYAGSQLGRVWVFYGSTGGVLDTGSAWLAESQLEQNAFLGGAVSSAGDVDGDGFDDVLIGAPWGGLAVDEGRVLLFRGSAEGLSPTAEWTADGGQADAQFGSSVSSAGDVNGDGFDDWIIGAPLHDGDKIDEGRAVVYHGAAAKRASVLAGSLIDALVWKAQVKVYDNDQDAPPVEFDGYDPLLGDSASAAVAQGPQPGSIVLSTGLANDLGLGDTDFGADGQPDVVRFRMEIDVPVGAETLQLTTQLITSEPTVTQDSAEIYFIPGGLLGGCRPAPLVATSQRNPPVSHGIDVGALAGWGRVELVFEVRDRDDLGRNDTALIVSRMFFTDLGLPEGALDLCGDAAPDYLDGPPHDVSAVAGTLSHTVTLFQVPGKQMPFIFSMRYNSATERQGVLGRKWSHSLEAYALLSGDGTDVGSCPDTIVIYPLVGGAEYFDEQPGCTYLPAHGGNYGKVVFFEGPDFVEYSTKSELRYVFDVVHATDPNVRLLGAIAEWAGAGNDLIVLHYDAQSRLDWVEDTRDTIFTFNHDAAGRLTSVEFPDDPWPQATIQYDPIWGNPVSVTDIGGHTTTFTYDAGGLGNLLAVTDGDGRIVAANEYETYQGLGVYQVGDRVRNQRHGGDDCEPTASGQEACGIYMVYDTDSLETVDRLGGRQVRRFDLKGRMVQQRTFLGRDATGQPCTEAEDICWLRTEFGHNADNEIERREARYHDDVGLRSAVTLTTYDSRGNPLTETDAEGHTVTMTYYDRAMDGHDKLKSVTEPPDAPGNPAGWLTTNYLYDSSTHDLLQVTDAQGNSVSYTYTPDRQVATVTDARGNAETTPYFWSYQYNGHGFPVREIDPLGHETNHTYNLLGMRTSTTDANLHTTTWTLDNLGRLLQETNALGQTRTHTYDSLGRILTTREENDALHAYEYRITGELERITDPLGNTVVNSYDQAGRLTALRDPLGGVTSYEYDAAGRIHRTVDAEGGTASAAYDGAGNQIAVMGPRGHVSRSTYDRLGRLVREEDPLGRAVEYSYLPRGLLHTMTNARDAGEPHTMQYVYDWAGYLLDVRLPSGGSISHINDENGNAISSNCTIPGLYGVPARTFDRLNRLITRSDAFGNDVRYEYDPVGNLVQLVYPTDADGNGQPDAISYTYDALNRLETVTDWAGRVTTYHYDEVGNPSQVDLPDGSTLSYTFDLAHRVIGVAAISPSSATIYDGSYVLDAAGRRLSASETLPLEPSATTSDLQLAYDAADQLEGYVYDADGNMVAGVIAGNPVTMDYDAFNRLVRTGSDYYRYDVDGFRVEVSRAGSVHRYVYDATAWPPQLLEEHDADGNLLARYVHGVGLISRDGGTDGYRVYHFDSRGNTVALTNTAGVITDRYAYSSYGTVTRHPDNATPNPFTLGGRFGSFDDNNGLHLMASRSYAPSLMRFMQKDIAGPRAIQNTQSLNPYAYVMGNPIQQVDPEGEWWFLAFGLVAGAAQMGSQMFENGDWDLGRIDWADVGIAAIGGAIAGACPTCSAIQNVGLSVLAGLVQVGLGEGKRALFDQREDGGRSSEEDGVTDTAVDEGNKGYADAFPAFFGDWSVNSRGSEDRSGSFGRGHPGSTFGYLGSEMPFVPTWSRAAAIAPQAGRAGADEAGVSTRQQALDLAGRRPRTTLANRGMEDGGPDGSIPMALQAGLSWVFGK